MSITATSDRNNDGHWITSLWGDFGGGMLEFNKLELFYKDKERWVRFYFTTHDIDSIQSVLNDIPKDNCVFELKDSKYFIIETPCAS